MSTNDQTERARLAALELAGHAFVGKIAAKRPEAATILGLLNAALAQRHLRVADVLEFLGTRQPAPTWAVAAAKAAVNCGRFSGDIDVEFDDVPLAAPADDNTGCWVGAWVWAPEPEAECARCDATIDEGAARDFNGEGKPICTGGQCAPGEGGG